MSHDALLHQASGAPSAGPATFASRTGLDSRRRAGPAAAPTRARLRSEAATPDLQAAIEVTSWRIEGLMARGRTFTECFWALAAVEYPLRSLHARYPLLVREDNNAANQP